MAQLLPYCIIPASIRLIPCTLKLFELPTEKLERDERPGPLNPPELIFLPILFPTMFDIEPVIRESMFLIIGDTPKLPIEL